MKLHAGTHTVEKSGTFEESKFSIEASSKAFFILSDGLYSNKILAVVRELSTNAYDSHVEAGKTSVPFDVHIPTQLNPVFFIRDYGTSMNHESCMQLYTTYFRSTRNNSNDAVGCLGLGSKAPFAYSDSFTVEAYMDGTKRIYNAYKDENGSPVFSLMDETETSEVNGIKVSINVNQYDISRFQHEANKVYEYFKVKPNFVGHKPTFNTTEKVLSGNNWYFDANSDENLIIMGQIAYPINVNQLAISQDKAFDSQRKFIEYSDGLRIFVNIGDVDITPSRESLSYSKETKENILAIINNILKDITLKIEEQIQNQPSLFKARMKYVQISNQCSSIRSAIESLQKSIVWQDHKLFDSVAGEYINLKNRADLNTLEKSAYRSKVDIKYNVERLYFQENNKFFVDDLNRGGISRIRQNLKDTYSSNGHVAYVYKLSSSETMDNCHFYEVLGGASKEDVIFTSTLPKINYNRNSSNSAGANAPAVHAQVFNEESGHFEDCNMSVKYENACYFVESKDNVEFGSTGTNSYNVARTLSYIHANYADDVGDCTFYLVKPSVVKTRKLEERSNWIKGNDVLRPILQKCYDDNKQNIINTMLKKPLSNERHEKWADILMLTTTDNDAKKIVNEYKDYSSSLDSMRDSMSIILDSARLFRIDNIDWSSKIDVNLFASKFDKTMKKYPMLKLLGGVWGDSDRKIVAQYIDSVECGTHAQNILSSM
jgi:hypothetical protein